MINQENATPEEENVCNSQKENVNEALDAMVTKPQQSYEKFVSSFTYLTLDDVNKNANLKQKILVDNKEDGTQIKTTIMKKAPDIGLEDDIEEEILDSVINIESESSGNKMEKKKLTQFDNFIGDDDENEVRDDEDDDVDGLTSGYHASFLTDITSKGLIPRISMETNNKSVGIISEEPSNENCDIVENVSVSESDCPFQPDDTGFLLNPGEIEGEITPPGLESILHVRSLNYSCIMRDDEIQQNNIDEKSITNEVQPFSIDEEFDYDNVILTPKFNGEEMQYLNNIPKFTTEET